jgi:nicotinate-nucleotide adenylyltransferase
VSPGNPLKAADGMAPYAARLASAREMARRSPIRVSDFEATAGTRFTVDTLDRLVRRWPNVQFIWLMGEDTLPDFHRWKAWRRLASLVPIAILSRPGYGDEARAARAMGWLRHFVRPSTMARQWASWSAPAIIFLRLPPDPTSATRLRALDPDWHHAFAARASGAARSPKE